jgi:hypothetical protein
MQPEVLAKVRTWVWTWVWRCWLCAAPTQTDKPRWRRGCSRLPLHDERLDGHGNTSSSSGGRAAAGPAARRSPRPVRAQQLQSESDRCEALHQPHAHLGRIIGHT